MKIIITWSCFSNNNKSYGFFRNNKEPLKRKKAKKDKQTTIQPNRKRQLYNQVWLVLLRFKLRFSGAVVVPNRMLVQFITTYAINVYHNESSNPVRDVVYSRQQYVIKFVSKLRHVGEFLPVLRFPLPIKHTTTNSWNIVKSGAKHHKPNPKLNLRLWGNGKNVYWVCF